MRIFVQRTWDGYTIPLEVKGPDTIGNVKSKISEKLNIPTDQQILLYKEQPLQNSHTILHYGIPEKATLQLRLKLKG